MLAADDSATVEHRREWKLEGKLWFLLKHSSMFRVTRFLSDCINQFHRGSVLCFYRVQSLRKCSLIVRPGNNFIFNKSIISVLCSTLHWLYFQVLKLCLQYSKHIHCKQASCRFSRVYLRPRFASPLQAAVRFGRFEFSLIF